MIEPHVHEQPVSFGIPDNAELAVVGPIGVLGRVGQCHLEVVDPEPHDLGACRAQRAVELEILDGQLRRSESEARDQKPGSHG